MKILNFYINDDEREILDAAVAFIPKDKKRKNYGVSSFVKEAAIKEAKRVIRKYS